MSFRPASPDLVEGRQVWGRNLSILGVFDCEDREGFKKQGKEALA
jgi:hypothetical protein